MNDEGSTTVEALAAVVILAVAGAAAFGAASGGIRAFKVAGKTAETAARALVLDDAFRAAARAVRVPWWDASARIELADDRAEVPYWDALPDKRLSISGSDSGVVVASPGGSRTFPYAELQSAAPYPDGNSPPRGLRIEYRVKGEKGSRTFTTVAEFGSWALGRETP